MGQTFYDSFLGTAGENNTKTTLWRRNLQNFVRHSLAESMDCASAAIAKATVEVPFLITK